jgi:hypothetical protein
MKIGINLVGIYNGERNRDFNKSKKSISEKVIKCWENEHQVSLYLTTYSSDQDKELLSFYSPKKYQFIEYEGSCRNQTYRKSLEFLENEDLDFIISTRFDIDFTESISSLNIDFHKMNFLFREGLNEWKDEKLVCDNLFCFPPKYRKNLIESLLESHLDGHTFTHSHRAYAYILPKIGEENIHFISEFNEYSHNNKYYNLLRHD